MDEVQAESGQGLVEPHRLILGAGQWAGLHAEPGLAEQVQAVDGATTDQ
jgi:hypothetical protein